ncbi:bifunctional proline dehydrogenase/L-glutamate gamma-semialdehyde dehydrogenase PutA [Nitrospirillum pindoramense]|uniref:Bifunctional protein PutA n=1 Tax=Nitrospirillum amazonense TaxID=28077 RepID=A0A560GN28_9PROT|nr:bifunctional proline dehydrogenase/L-glutamate gamma-semialdehyde dehydrogenase PutA [Nitrospirillum amazonense]TWB35171.1 L-proline dehydrogenase /delta-1-pyrroline-5-carboxylate dehydrogenase [Nitrospirillum amazonense]
MYQATAPSSSSSPATPDLDGPRAALRRAKHVNEETAVRALLAAHGLTTQERRAIDAQAVDVVNAARARRSELGPLDAFMQEFGLSNQEGIALMCIAECLLRIADPATADRLIAEKITKGQWDQHLGQSDSAFVNAAAWGLMLTGRVVEVDTKKQGDAPGLLRRLVQRSGEPVIRAAMMKAMRVMGEHFVMGRTIAEAVAEAKKAKPEGTVHSYDMLGEGARTWEQADRYQASYLNAIDTVGKAAAGRGPYAAPGVSIKLSALHPRYVFAKRADVMAQLLPRVKDLCLAAKRWDINLTIDAEEADRLDISLDLLEALARDGDLAGWNGLGLAIQAYQKRTAHLVDWLAALARSAGRRLMVRLVKGAYWDTEIKFSQTQGHADYPVYTKKAATDLSYLVCARRMLAAKDAIYPQFATHNAYTIAAILHLAGDNRDLEFQRLHGMGDLLYAAARDRLKNVPRVRIYAPVGTHEDLLPYLVRRLLENGANSNFVNAYMDPAIPVGQVVADPIALLEALPVLRHAGIPTPDKLYGDDRANSRGVDLTDEATVRTLRAGIDAALAQAWTAAPIVGGQDVAGQKARPVLDPSDRTRTVGTTADATAEHIDRALALAAKAQPGWDALGGEGRARILDAMGDALEADTPALLGILIREAGKTWGDAVAEVREAVDFCRYYADLARKQFGAPTRLPGPTGESNELSLHGRGTFVCISPWNFPLAIFTGQVAAALAAGNAVAAKPAEQTTLVGARAVRLFHKAGVPGDILHLLPGDGETVGAALVADARIGGVAFTGSTETARLINRALAARDGAIVPLIAETGGQNAMIVDSTALLEQVVDDCITSAFQSAGQRCSAMRVLFVQDDVADQMAHLLKGAMQLVTLGDPLDLATDVGPIIDEDARKILVAHAARMDREAKLVHACDPGADLANGTFFGPRLYEIDSLKRLPREVFGPILHLVRWKADSLDQVLADIDATGYGLTLGVHSRLEGRAQEIFKRLNCGNTYINRNMVGAVVGVQPFGGHGLSGTGPKAGGPHYLLRFATEKTLTVNITAFGGNADLLGLGG